jgi:4-amino-4-deoxy-L-arabinose transferase-like glycosyltransferase
MTTSDIASTDGSLDDAGPRWRWLWIVVFTLTALRLLALYLSPGQLGFDEAQYWVWSCEPAFGYFSKPPLIAWVIWLETHLFGSSAAAIRSSAPLLHGATALILAHAGRRLYGSEAGFWTGISYALLPGIALSSFLMTTDVSLLFFWSVALSALFASIEKPQWRNAIVFGVSLGLGLNAKYAMIYLPVMLLLAAWKLPWLRKNVLQRQDPVAVLIATVIIAPNVWWNVTHGFATLRHTGANMHWALNRINAREGFEFAFAQFGVAGPVVFGVMLAALLFHRRSERADIDVLLLWLSWPLLIAVTIQGFLSGANPNWGAAAYPAGVILAAALLTRRPRALMSHAVISVTLALAILAMTMFVDPKNARGPFRQYRQLGGWSETAQALSAMAHKHSASRIVFDSRPVVAGMTYALRHEKIEVVAYAPRSEASGEYSEWPRRWSDGDPVKGTLLAGIDPDRAAALGARPVGEIAAPIYSARDGRMVVYGFAGSQPDQPDSIFPSTSSP